MRDQRRPRQELINEVVALRKQVLDLCHAMEARRRVEEALRHSEERLRAMADASPVGLCLFQADGTAVAANERFARLLGYVSSGDLLDGSGGRIFATPTEEARVLQVIHSGGCAVAALLRRKSGAVCSSSIL